MRTYQDDKERRWANADRAGRDERRDLRSRNGRNNSDGRELHVVSVQICVCAVCTGRLRQMKRVPAREAVPHNAGGG